MGFEELDNPGECGEPDNSPRAGGIFFLGIKPIAVRSKPSELSAQSGSFAPKAVTAMLKILEASAVVKAGGLEESDGAGAISQQLSALSATISCGAGAGRVFQS